MGFIYFLIILKEAILDFFLNLKIQIYQDIIQIFVS